MRNALVLFAMLLAATGCKSKSKDDKAKPSTTGKVQPKSADAAPAKAAQTSAVGDKAAYEMAIYFMPRAKTDPHKALAAVLAKHPGVHLTEKVARDMKLPALVVKEPAVDKYGPPAPEVLKREGRGLDAKLAKAVQKTKGAFVMMFFMEGKDAARMHVVALSIVTEVAQATGGLLWDEETRELFTPDAWAARIRAAKQQPPNLLPHVTVRETTADGATRLVSRGLAKLGLPDVVVAGVPAEALARARTLVRLMAQTIGEGGTLDAKDSLSVELAAVKNPAAKAALLAEAGGGKAAMVPVAKVSPERGDPRNRLWQVNAAGKGTAAENLGALLTEVLGAPTEDAPAKEPAAKKPAAKKPAAKKPAAKKPD